MVDRHDSVATSPPSDLQWHRTIRPFVYAFTEIITFTFLSRPPLEDAGLAVSELWSSTVQAYHAHPGTTMVWWGYDIENPKNVLLFVDWQSSADYTAYISSSTYSALQNEWNNSLGLKFCSSFAQRFILSDYAPRRRQVLVPSEKCYFENCVTVWLSLHIPPGCDLASVEPSDPSTLYGTKHEMWSAVWHSFAQSSLLSKGGWISSAWAAGWAIDVTEGLEGDEDSDAWKTFLGLFRFETIESARVFFGYTGDAFYEHLKATGVASWEGMDGAVVEMRYLKMREELPKPDRLSMYAMVPEGYQGALSPSSSKGP